MDCNQIWRDAIVFNESSITSVMQRCCSIDTDAWCKRTLKLCSDRAKAKLFFDVFRLFNDLFRFDSRFRLV